MPVPNANLSEPELSSAIEAAVQRLERTSCAEIVVVMAGRSDEYREIPWMVGGVVGWLTLAVMVWSPFSFSDLWLPADAALLGVAAGFWARGSSSLARLFVRASSRKARVQAAAEACFVQETVHGTRRRTGLLVYVSRVERMVVVLPDQGLLGKIPAAELVKLRIDGAAPDGLLVGLEALGVLLAQYAPVDGDVDNEISDSPRVRP